MAISKKDIMKWDYATHSYYDCIFPKDWNVKLYCESFDEIISCAGCGKKLCYGDCYTSKEIHNSIGLGYPVCEECYSKEIERWRKDESICD